MMVRDKNTFDVKLEVLAAAMQEFYHLRPEQVVIHNKGLFSRNYKTEVLQVTEDKNHIKAKKFHLSIAREGIYDILPEGLFHRTLHKNANIDTQESVQEIKLHQREEKEARKFFLPIEQEFYRIQIESEIQEKKVYLSHFDRDQYDLFRDLWKIPAYLSEDQVKLLLNLFPLLHRIVGNLKFTALCYTLVMGVPVQMEIADISIDPEDDVKASRLGFTCLGKDSILGLFVENLHPGLKIQVGPIQAEQIPDYLEEGKSWKLINYLNDYFIPAHLEYTVNFELEEQEKEFQMEATAGGSSILAYSTYL